MRLAARKTLHMPARKSSSPFFTNCCKLRTVYLLPAFLRSGYHATPGRGRTRGGKEQTKANPFFFGEKSEQRSLAILPQDTKRGASFTLLSKGAFK